MSRRLYYRGRRAEAVREAANAELLVVGGHGGLVTYDGAGGALDKKGAPVDRAFLLTNDGRLLGDAALDIEYGCLNFRTGRLDRNVRAGRDATSGEWVRHKFLANKAKDSLQILGGVQRLRLPPNTLLVHGSVAPSIMERQTDDASDRGSSLPYVAYHNYVVVHQQLLEWFEIPEAVVTGAASGWQKKDPGSLRQDSSGADQGVAFETQQHLGFVRVFLTI